MTRKEIAYYVKRIPQIERGIKSGKKRISFYVGNRKEEIELVEEVCEIYKIVEEVLRSENKVTSLMGRMSIKKGRQDYRVMIELTMSATMYYRIKKLIHGKIYNCCIARGLVTYEEILSEEIV